MFAAALCHGQSYTVEGLAGNGTAGYSGDGRRSSLAQLDSPGPVVLDTSGRLWFVDGQGARLRRIEADGTIRTAVSAPEGTTVTDVTAGLNNTIYYVLGANTIRSINGSGVDTVYAPAGTFSAIRAIAAEPTGTLLVADGLRIRRYATNGVTEVAVLPEAVTSVTAGPANKYCAVAGPTVYCGGGTSGASASPVVIAGTIVPGGRVVLDRWGDLYVSGERISKVIDNKLTQLIGLVDAGYSGDGGPSVSARVNGPTGMTVDPAGTLFFADTGNHRVRFLRPPFVGTISAVNPRDNIGEVWPKDLTLQWTTFLNAAQFDVLFGTSPDNLAVIGTSSSGSFALTQVPRDRTRYFWQVRTQFTPFPPVESPVFSFDTTTSASVPPLPITNASPPDFSFAHPLDVTLSWQGGGAELYEVLAGVDSTRLGRIGLTSETRLSLNGLPAETTIYWKVVAYNETGATESKPFQFTTGPRNGYPWMIDTLAGLPRPTADGTLATEAVLNYPRKPVVDSAGNRYFLNGDRTIRRIGTDGKLATTVTLTTGTFSALGGDRQSSILHFATPEYLSRVDLRTSVRTFLAGQITRRGFAGDGGPATLALFDGISSIAPDRRSNVYVADTNNNRVRIVTSNQQVRTFAGSGECVAGLPDPLPEKATDWPLCGPTRVAVMDSGAVLIHATGILLRVTPEGVATLIAGTGQPGYSGDQGPALGARIGPLSGLASDQAGSVYLLDSAAMTVRLIDPEGTITTWLGGRDTDGRAVGFAGDGGAGSAAKFQQPVGLVVDALGNVLIGDSRNHRIRQADPQGMVRTIAGTDTVLFERGPAASAWLYNPSDVAVDGGNNIFVVDALNNRIRRITQTRGFDTVAGGGTTGVGGSPSLSGSDARTLRLDLTAGSVLSFDQTGDLSFTTAPTAAVPESTTDLVMAIRPNSIVSSVLLSRISRPGGIARGRLGEVYVSDTLGHRILRINRDGSAAFIAGTGVAGVAGDGGPAAVAQVNFPRNLVFGPDSALYVAEQGRIRKIGTDGRIVTVAFETAQGMAFDPQGTLYVAAGRSIYLTGTDRRSPDTLTLLRIAGNQGGEQVPAAGFLNALAARITEPRGLAYTPQSELVFADAAENAVRRLSRNLPKTLSIVSGDNQIVNDRFVTPQALRVKVVGRTGVPVGGILVRFTAKVRDTTTNLQSLSTDANGEVAIFPTLTMKEADIRVIATVFGADNTVEFRVTGRTLE